MIVAKGFAVISFGLIDISTVSPTRRGALVNWIVTCARLPVFAWTTDEEIERLWRGCRGSHRDHDCIEVDIAPALIPQEHPCAPGPAAESCGMAGSPNQRIRVNTYRSAEA